jgi:hypothetical protein
MATDVLTDWGEVLDLCARREPEALQLEFKEKEDPAVFSLSKTDKKNIAKAVSSLGNSDGGLLVFGIRTEREVGLDVAAEVKAISQVDRFAAQFRLACATGIGPEIEGLRVRVLGEPGSECGVIVCEVPRSPRRPHMSTAPGEQRYYRRTFEGVVPMTPSEVRDLHLAVRDAVLEPVVKLGGGASFHSMNGWIAVKSSVSFALKNVGDRACRSPFLRVSAQPQVSSVGAYRDPASGLWRSNAEYEQLIHVGDTLPVFTLDYIGRIFDDRLRQVHGVRELLFAVEVYDGAGNVHSATVTDQVPIDRLNFEITFGAENATAQSRRMSFSRNELARGVLAAAQASYGDQLAGRAGVWRADVFQEMCGLTSDDLAELAR